MMLRIISPFFLVCVFVSVQGQNPVFYGLDTQLGRILPHSTELEPLTSNSIWGTGVEVSRIKLGQAAWDQCHCYTKSGVSFTYFSFQNSHLGSASNLIFFTEPLLSLNKKLTYSLRGGVGFSYVSQVYDEEVNPDNLFFSSHLSFIMLAQLKINYQLNQAYAFHLGIHYNHISNGGSKQPNKGMNFPTIGLGLSYTTHTYHLEKREKNKGQKGKLQAYARLFGTMPEVGGDVDVDKNERRLLLGIAGGGLYHLTHTNAFNLGVEFVNNQAYKVRFEQDESDQDHRTLGITLGHNFVFGRLTFNQQIGWYAYKKHSLVTGDFFQRYELLYAITSNIQAGTSLRAHGHVAENLDLRIGYLF